MFPFLRIELVVTQGLGQPEGGPSALSCTVSYSGPC